jgi:hypothetical protein
MYRQLWQAGMKAIGKAIVIVDLSAQMSRHNQGFDRVWQGEIQPEDLSLDRGKLASAPVPLKLV